MNRRAFFSFLPAAPIGMVMAAEAMAKAPPVSMAPDKSLMTLAAHKPPPPPIAPVPKPVNFPRWSEYISTKGQSGSLNIYDVGDNWVSNYITTAQPSNIVLGEGFKVEAAPGQFDSETRVAMSVGKDGHLWLKINDEWKRIVTE